MTTFQSPENRASARAWPFLLAAALTACGPADPYQTLRFGFLPRYAAAPGGAPVLLSNDAWWHRLNDPVLDRLIVLALDRNLTLATARERISEADAARRAVPGAGLITSSASLGGQGSEAAGPDLRAGIQVGLNWLLDPYGSRRRELAISEAAFDSSLAERDAARLLLLYKLGTTYSDLRYRQRILDLGREELASRQRTLTLIRRLSDAGELTRLEITRSEARVAELHSRLPGYEADIQSRLNEISVLAGQAPGSLPAEIAGALARPGAQPVPALPPDIGIPADLLRNRPDIAIAERAYYSAVARIGVAQAALYPRLSLTGTISFDATDGGADYFFGPRVEFPALPAGSGKAAVDVRRAQARQAHEAWKATVLNAILEVENALVQYRAVSASTQSAARAARLYREALGQTREVFRRNEATLTDLISAEEAVAGADRALAEFLYRQAASFVELNVRLGAGHAATE
jgi:multidrug efflux system outer membrane protein